MGADVFLLVFSIISKASYEKIYKKRIPELRDYPLKFIILVSITMILGGTLQGLKTWRQHDGSSRFVVLSVRFSNFKNTRGNSLESPTDFDLPGATEESGRKLKVYALEKKPNEPFM
ncbi:rac-like GTP-binding protein ARAC2 [Pistacia vera]|uniref:rac-like GTP-binding protein ARAC2 n=1 Tax=Pistacia vera TaxID=55513 RepID=UPI001263769F|nr:rac-like GTP-binding protein ARAC2 [Pistacia vera]